MPSAYMNFKVFHDYMTKFKVLQGLFFFSFSSQGHKRGTLEASFLHVPNKLSPFYTMMSVLWQLHLCCS